VRPECRFTDDYKQVGAFLIARWDLHKKAAEEARQKAKVDAKGKERASEVDKNDITNKKSKTASMDTKRVGPLDKSKIKRAKPDHPIYGENGIMHHVLWYKTGAATSMALDDKFEAKDARVFGHNGLEVGTWFARQLTALRDGAHGLYLSPFLSPLLDESRTDIVIYCRRANGRHCGGH
jgi:hypothetical protein